MASVDFETNGAIAIVTINRPEARNAVDGPTPSAAAFVLDEELPPDEADTDGSGGSSLAFAARPGDFTADPTAELIDEDFCARFYAYLRKPLDDAEEAALRLTCERAELQDGQAILELGCGWGSLSLWMAERYPHAQVTALSNSASQREHIEAQAAQRRLANLNVVTCDINTFETADRFDRVVSVEMFEHLRNWPQAFARIARWLRPQGKFFMHVFAHREAPYAFVERDASDWMSKYFFSGGMMPSDDLALHCQDDLRVLHRWRWDGSHYARTAEAWLSNMDARRDLLMPVFEQTYAGQAAVWWVRWRLFFMSVAELFGYERGQQWWVSQYLFASRA